MKNSTLSVDDDCEEGQEEKYLDDMDPDGVILLPSNKSRALQTFENESDEDNDDDMEKQETTVGWRSVSGTCSICLAQYEPDETVVWSSTCDHVFHQHCLIKWFIRHGTPECPMCRSQFSDTIGDSGTDDRDNVEVRPAEEEEAPGVYYDEGVVVAVVDDSVHEEEGDDDDDDDDDDEARDVVQTPTATSATTAEEAG